MVTGEHSDKAPEAVAVVVTYNSAADVRRCVDALLATRAEDVPTLSIVVVDNASADGTLAELHSYGPDIEVVANPDNTGYAVGNNLGVARSRAPVAVIVNPDCAVDPGCVRRLLDTLAADRSVGIAAALLRSENGEPQYFARRDVSLPLSLVMWELTWLGRRIDRGRRNSKAFRRRRYVAEFDAFLASDAPTLEVETAAGACIAVRNQGDAVFDEALPLMFNDTDLARRLADCGERVVVVRDATATHGYGASIRAVPSPALRAEFVRSLLLHVGRTSAIRALNARLIFALDAFLTLSVAVFGPRRLRRETLRWARGTAGGIGWPWGGTKPWMTQQDGIARDR